MVRVQKNNKTDRKWAEKMRDIEKELEGFLEKYKKELVEAGKELLHEQPPALTETLFALYETNGNRLEYESVYFRRRKMLSVFGILSVLERKKEYVEALENILTAVLEEKCWALPAHVNRQYEGWQLQIDLFAAETAFYLTEIAELLKDTLSQDLQNRIREEVFKRVLTPFMSSTVPYADWERSKTNWCAVCCGSIGAAALRLITEKEVLEPVLERICQALEYYVQGFCTDGACLEGISYYTYGLSFFTGFSELLREYTAGKINLLADERVRKAALFQQVCFLPGGRSISFSDADSRDTFRVGLTACLAMQYPEVEFPDFSMASGLESDNCYRYLPLSRDIFFTQKYLEELRRKKALGEQSTLLCTEEKTKENTAWGRKTGQICFPDAQWSVSVSRNNCVLAVKGGHNGEPHNHNDVGSFLYISDGNVIFEDLGAGEYTAEYFGAERYEVLCCRSMGHNLPIPFGMEQKAGERYGAEAFYCDGSGKTTMQIEGAYGLKSEGSIRRTLQLDFLDGNMQLEDLFQLKREKKPGVKIVENFVTRWKPCCMSYGFFIQAGQYGYKIYCRNAENFRILKKEHRNHKGVPETVWLMQYDVKEENRKTGIRLERKLYT